MVAVVFGSGWIRTLNGDERTQGTTGTVDARAREVGAEISEKVSQGATLAEAALAEAKLTAKIKGKIALDDTLKGNEVNVDTHGTIVTLKGTVLTRSQRDRVVQLAKETEGVSQVVDRLEVKPK